MRNREAILLALCCEQQNSTSKTRPLIFVPSSTSARSGERRYGLRARFVLRSARRRCACCARVAYSRARDPSGRPMRDGNMACPMASPWCGMSPRRVVYRCAPARSRRRPCSVGPPGAGRREQRRSGGVAERVECPVRGKCKGKCQRATSLKRVGGRGGARPSRVGRRRRRSSPVARPTTDGDGGRGHPGPM